MGHNESPSAKQAIGFLMTFEDVTSIPSNKGQGQTLLGFLEILQPQTHADGRRQKRKNICYCPTRSGNPESLTVEQHKQSNVDLPPKVFLTMREDKED
ncbi:MAG: hypothetical protein GY868_21555 [Deltaproteobacteria bacterium]|nr:hypothetical protein [Deltaproteobacteria bacterium]